MPTVTSKDGTKIAFEKVRSGPAVFLVNCAMFYPRVFDTTLEDLAELLGESTNTEPFTKVREIYMEVLWEMFHPIEA